MAKTLDFTTRKKTYLTVKLDDKKKTVLLIGTPNKEVLTEFLGIQERFDAEDEADKETINDLYNVCARVMSFNKGGINITPDYLSKECKFDIEDIMVFFRGYSEFLESVTNVKN